MISYTKDEFDQALQYELKIFHRHSTPQEFPAAYLITGQPGAGKSASASALLSMYENDIVFINGDTFREAHPHFEDILQKYGDDTVSYTQDFSGQMVEACIDCLSREKRNLIIEGTLRTVKVPKDTCQLLKGRGYRAILAFLLVRPEISFLSAVRRYKKLKAAGGFARVTAQAHHDNVVLSIPANLHELYNQNIFDDILILDRNQDILYRCRDNPKMDPSDMVRNEFNRSLSPKERDGIEKTFSPYLDIKEIHEILDHYSFILKKI